MYKCFVTLFICFAFATSRADDQSIRLATTEWCPYTCVEKSAADNIIGRYLEAVFKQKDIDLDIESFPWSRSIQLAESGNVNGLLTAVNSEAPTLLFTTTPTDYYQVCFYTISSNWIYAEPLNLGENRLGIIQNYGYTPEIDQYIAGNAQQVGFEVLGGPRSTQRLLKMLVSGRVDIIVEDKLVLLREAQLAGIDLSTVRNVGCAEAQPYFLALHPEFAGAPKIIQWLNTALASDENIALLNQFKQELESRR
jgi:polar amino acid transport system substrate-binding protein